MLDTTAKLFMTFKKIVMGNMDKQAGGRNQESSDDKETECDSMMLKTFYHLYIWVVT